MQSSHVLSAWVCTQDLWKKCPHCLSPAAATWTSYGSRNGNVSTGQKSFCETWTPQRHQFPSKPASKLVSGQINYFCLLHSNPFPNNNKNRNEVLSKATTVCVANTLVFLHICFGFATWIWKYLGKKSLICPSSAIRESTG